MAYGTKSHPKSDAGSEPIADGWAIRALRSLLGFDPIPIISAMQTEIPATAEKMKTGIDSLVASMKNIDARLAAIERRLDIGGTIIETENTNVRPNGGFVVGTIEPEK